MQAGGFTETIWHFIGYLHLADSVARTPVFYEGDPPPPPPAEKHDPGHEPLRGFAFDELASTPTNAPEIPVSEPPTSAHLAQLSDAVSIPSPALPVFRLPAKPLPPSLEDVGWDGNRGHTIERAIAVEHGEGSQADLGIRQVNLASDRDLVTSDAIRYADGSLVVPPELRLDAAFDELVDQANEIAPDGIPDMMNALQADTAELVAWTSERDARWSETGSPDVNGSAPEPAPEGRIVDGVAGGPEPYVPTIVEIALWRPEETEDAPKVTAAEAKHEIVGPTDGVATIAETGLNVQINAAYIFDVNEAVGSMMVGGDYYYSRGIVQANILVDNDRFDVAVSGALDPTVQTAGNEAHNIAEFVVHVSTIEVQGAAATPHWAIDLVLGDFYDVKAVIQINGLDDSDRTVQAESGTYYNLGTGANQQLNLAEIYGIERYDIIIIGGDYHRGDWIYQYNIMLDPDYATLYSTGGAEDDTAVTTGFNSLTNSASIESYDAPAFKPMLDAHHDLMGLLADGVTVLTPNADWDLHGSASGTLSILFVSGSYYDLNVITQVNLLIDGDQSIQASANEGTEQGISAGGNTAINEAIIIDAGLLSTSNYLGGDAYEEAVLIQVNIVTDSDTVTIHDTTTLVPELVAFAEHAAREPEPECPSAPVPDPAQLDHMTSNILI